MPQRGQDLALGHEAPHAGLAVDPLAQQLDRNLAVCSLGERVKLS